MNEVFLEGTVASMALVEYAASAKQHCVCQLRVVHRNQKQQTVSELYTINAWNRCRNGSDGESIRNSAGNTAVA